MAFQWGVPQSTVIIFLTGEEYYLIKYYGIKNKPIKSIDEIGNVKWGEEETNKEGKPILYIDIDIEEVESESEGVIVQPRLLTIDGNAFWVYQNNLESMGGIPSIHMELEPFEWVMARLKLTDKDLDKTSEYSTIWGIMRRTFPLSSRIVLSDNPMKPIWLLLSTIEGEKINWDNPSIAPLIDMKMQLDRKDRRISDLESEVKELRDRNRDLLRLTKEVKDEYKDIFGEEKITFPVPPEFTGTKIRNGKVV